jgi:hypothetical protein
MMQMHQTASQRRQCFCCWVSRSSPLARPSLRRSSSCRRCFARAKRAVTDGDRPGTARRRHPGPARADAAAGAEGEDARRAPASARHPAPGLQSRVAASRRACPRSPANHSPPAQRVTGAGRACTVDRQSTRRPILRVRQSGDWLHAASA